MEAIAGVFTSRSDAERALNELHNIGLSADKTTFLAPGTVDQVNTEMESVAADATEQPGMAKAMGALLGGGIGVTGGAILMALVPGVGAISAFGLLGAAILGAAGATVGGAAANKVEKDSFQGLPEDEIFVYEDALRKGRSVVIALAQDDDQAKQVRSLLERTGAETVDAAREQWWIGLRSAEQAHYASGEDSGDKERFYRMGFEAALHAKNRCREFDQVSAEMDAALEDAKRQHPGANVEEPFIRGYQRGREHYQQMCDEGKKVA
jgi:hypothetical protein